MLYCQFVFLHLVIWWRQRHETRQYDSGFQACQLSTQLLVASLSTSASLLALFCFFCCSFSPLCTVVFSSAIHLATENNSSNNNNLRLIMVKTNRSTLHTVYNIQQSATQGSNHVTHRLSHRTATTRFSLESIGC